MLGECALCRERAELVKSHYMPAAVYKTIRARDAGKHPAPVIIDKNAGSAFQSNRQVRKYLLCSSCEGRFDRYGEDPVSRIWAKANGVFPLLDAIDQGQPSDVYLGQRVYNSPHMPPGIDDEALLYFAASVFWRGSIVKWHGAASSAFASLGSRYDELFRAFLLGDSEFPSDARLSVTALRPEHLHGVCYFPSRRGNELLIGRKVRIHRFMVPGTLFVLSTGRVLRAVNSEVEKKSGHVDFFDWNPTNFEFFDSVIDTGDRIVSRGNLANR